MSDVKSYYLREDCPGGAWMAENTFDERREELYVRKEDYDRLRAERDGLRAKLEPHAKWLRTAAERLYKEQREYAIANTCDEAADAIAAALASTTAGSQPTGEG